ncbi:unnamed protein product, partial [Pleuronectes platessa]
MTGHLHDTTETAAPLSRLKYRHPYNKAAQELLRSTTEDLSKDGWLAAAWKQEWERVGQPKSTTTSWIQEGWTQETFFHAGMGLLLNRLRTGRSVKSSMKKWAWQTALHASVVPEQTVEHIMTTCPLHRPPSEAGLFDRRNNWERSRKSPMSFDKKSGNLSYTHKCTHIFYKSCMETAASIDKNKRVRHKTTQGAWKKGEGGKEESVGE